ncbi:fibropellin-1-like [Argopecten irradians]|uniref:fibropellin-1-like n=1 Tax=Argopecten irradians TaxID=31199 RepID=UPI003719C84F
MSSRNCLRYWKIFLVVLFFVPTTRSEINISVSKIASQSSNQETSKWLAQQGVDNYGTAHRFAGYSLYVSNSTNQADGFLCYKDNSASAQDVNINPTHQCPSVAQYVIVYNQVSDLKYDWQENFATLELCEVQVMGCPVGKYGSGNCDHTCSVDCFGGNCNSVSGFCFYCFDGKYGNDCQLTCSANCNKSCEKDSGQCDACIAGKTGVSCEDNCAVNCVSCSQSSATDCFECENGKHGTACQLNCPNNCRGRTCFKDDGFCFGK